MCRRPEAEGELIKEGGSDEEATHNQATHKRNPEAKGELHPGGISATGVRHTTAVRMGQETSE